MAQERRVDVSSLEPPEPMQAVIEALRGLGEDEYLVMCHRRQPLPLFAMLLEMGHCYRVRAGALTSYEIVIWPAGNSELEALCGPADARPVDGPSGSSGSSDNSDGNTP